MSSRSKRMDGGAYRRYKSMMSRHAKPGKDRSGSYTRPNRKRRKQ